MKGGLKVAVVVVTYNRKELLRACLQALLNQTRPLDEIIVIDNASTDGTDHMIRSEFPQVTHVKLPENIGGAGGFHEGMKLAYEKGHDWIWLMDDDAVPMSDALEALMEAIGNVHAERFVLLPRQVQSGNLGSGRDGGMLELTNNFTFVGPLIPRRAITEIGFPRSDFFIYCDDLDYHIRLVKAGFNTYYVPSSHIVHEDWGLKSRLDEPGVPDWKRYYEVRNRIICFRTEWGRWKLFRYVLYIAKRAFIAAISERRLRKTWYLLRGLIDGLLNRTGKRIHPDSASQ